MVPAVVGHARGLGREGTSHHDFQISSLSDSASPCATRGLVGAGQRGRASARDFIVCEALRLARVQLLL
jgi:hypothetical protein